MQQQPAPVFIGGKGSSWSSPSWEAAMRVVPRDVVDLRGVTEQADGSRLRFADDPNVEITTLATNDIGATEALQKEKIVPAFLKATDDYKVAQARARELRSFVPMHLGDEQWAHRLPDKDFVAPRLRPAATDLKPLVQSATSGSDSSVNALSLLKSQLTASGTSTSQAAPSSSQPSSPRPTPSLLGLVFKTTAHDVEVSGKVVSVELNGNAPSYKGKWESGQETFMSDEQL
eukprot:6516080-Pyramimonas_sp.AAC.1